MKKATTNPPAFIERRKVSSRSTKYIIIALMVFAGAFSSFFLMTQSLRLDEAQSLWQTSHSSLKILNIIAQDVHVPLYHILLHSWQVIFGNGVEIARVFSLFFFLLTIPALYMLGKLAYDHRTAIFATALFALSPFLNWYGSEIRMYSLLTFLTVLNQYFFMRIYQHKETVPHWVIWGGYALTAFLGMYTHYFFAFILISQAVFFVMRYQKFPKHSVRNFTIVGAAILGLFAPWILYVRSLGTASNTQPLLVKPNSVNVFNTFSQFIFGYQNDRINTILVSLWPISIVMGFLSLRKGRSSPSGSLYFFLSFLIPVLAAFVLSLTLKPVFLSRYLIIVIPSLYLFLSWRISMFGPQLNKLVKSALIVIFMVALVQQAVSASTPVKENYASAANYLYSQSNAQDVVIISAPFTIYPIEYYYQGPTKLVTLPLWDRKEVTPAFNPDTLPNEVKSITQTNRRAYLLLSYDQGYEETIRLYFDNNFQRLEKKEFSTGLTMYVYQIRYDIPD